MFSILHITDLHRSKTDPISNPELLSALMSDRDRYVVENPPIRAPDAIVVSGDLIQGVTLGATDSAAQLGAQYEVAHQFITDLTDRFLGGDRSKVIIVPGNHDIDWNAAFAAMAEVDPATGPLSLPGALYEQGSRYRWDWKSRRLYRIKDDAAYASRLDAFWSFFDRFYSGVTGMLSVSRGSDANLYSLDDGRIGVAAFNSCAGNDCFSFHGEIPREAVAQAYMDLKDRGPWRLRIAVWHHDVEGPPNRADYMDADIVRGMIGRGFRLGLYGHQHRLQVTPQHARLLDDETMAIASAGSLCAGRWELPTGALRGYSIIEISDDYSSARVHVREMGFANLFTRAVLRDFSGRSHVDLTWTTPLDRESASWKRSNAYERPTMGLANVVGPQPSAIRILAPKGCRSTKAQNPTSSKIRERFADNLPCANPFGTRRRCGSISVVQPISCDLAPMPFWRQRGTKGFQQRRQRLREGVWRIDDEKTRAVVDAGLDAVIQPMLDAHEFGYAELA
jgi:hypothetical protein